MEVKTDTKEKFHAINVMAPLLSANMAADLRNQLEPLLHHDVKNVVLNMKDVAAMDVEAAEVVVKLQQSFYEAGASFVVCCLQQDVAAFLDDQNLLELMNATPTESEAWDIVQMEEIERELLDGEDSF